MFNPTWKLYFDTQSVELDVTLHYKISQVDMFCKSKKYVFEETN